MSLTGVYQGINIPRSPESTSLQLANYVGPRAIKRLIAVKSVLFSPNKTPSAQEILGVGWDAIGEICMPLEL